MTNENSENKLDFNISLIGKLCKRKPHGRICTVLDVDIIRQLIKIKDGHWVGKVTFKTFLTKWQLLD